MAYTKTKWVNGTTKLNAYNLNHIEDGIEENSNAIDTNTEAISNLQESTNGSISEVKASMEKMAAQLTNNSLDGSVIKDESISESKLVKSSSSTSGKIICFLGDSISTAYNSVPTNDGFNEQHAVYYTSSRVNTYLGGSIDNTWWRMLDKVLATYDYNSTTGGEVATSYVYTNDVAKLCSGKTINVLRLKGTAAGKFSIFKLSAPITTAGSFDAMHITKTLLEQIDLTVDSEPRVYKLSKNYELGDNEVLAFGNNVTSSEAGRFAYVANKPSLPEGVSSFYYHARSGGNVGFQATTQALCIDVGYID